MMNIDEENGRLTRSRHQTLKTMSNVQIVRGHFVGQLAMNKLRMRGTRFCTERDVAIRRNSTLPTLDGRPVRTCGGTVRIPRARCHCHSLSLSASAPVVAGRVGSFDVPSQRVRGGQSATLDAEGVSDLLVKAISEAQVSLYV